MDFCENSQYSTYDPNYSISTVMDRIDTLQLTSQRSQKVLVISGEIKCSVKHPGLQLLCKSAATPN